MRGLDGKVVVVAGGATGIGAATSRRLAEEGARVVVGDVDGEGAEAVAGELSSAGATALPFQFDIVNEDACRALIEFAVSELGGLDGLFNVAADTSSETLGRDSEIVSVPVEVWRRTLDVNLTGTFFTCRHAIPPLLARGGGAIVNTLSGLIFYGDPTRPAYGASKGALVALTKHVAARYGKQGIRCNAVAPGFVLTEQAQRNVSPAEQEAVLAAVKSPRLGEPRDIAATAAFLLSDDAEWINGQVHLVNGGR